MNGWQDWKAWPLWSGNIGDPRNAPAESAQTFYSTLSLGQPPKGTDLPTVRVPTGVYRKLRTVFTNLSTSAAAANRYFRIYYADDQGNKIGGAAIGSNIQATSVNDIFGGIGLTSPTTGGGGNSNTFANGQPATFALPDVFLPPKSQIIFSTVALDANDQFSASAISVEDLAFGPVGTVFTPGNQGTSNSIVQNSNQGTVAGQTAGQAGINLRNRGGLF